MAETKINPFCAWVWELDGGEDEGLLDSWAARPFGWSKRSVNFLTDNSHKTQVCKSKLADPVGALRRILLVDDADLTLDFDLTDTEQLQRTDGGDQQRGSLAP